MIENFDPSVVDWSRAQFALTAIYHWLFVPLTLGLSFIVAFMESLYVKTGDPEWKKITKFWMTLFGINFAIGVATGIILEFEFGTNWSNYSWFVGDIFGAPLAIEGIFAFFLESTFIAVMFFGWNKVSKGFHLTSTWLVAIGANISALWILVANAWMQYPAGMHFNPDKVRNEMINFWDVLFSPVAINKFLHTISSGFVLASAFVIGISCWYLLKKRELSLAKKSILLASIFGIISSLYLAFTGDTSARLMAHKQPMKFAAMEGLYNGQDNAPLIVFGFLVPKEDTVPPVSRTLPLRFEIPKLLSIMSFHDPNAYVPGIKDLISGNKKQHILSASEKISRGLVARETLKKLREAKDNKDQRSYDSIRNIFSEETFLKEYFCYFGYSFFKNTVSLVPSVPLSFYSFHTMVGLGIYFIVFFILIFLAVYRKKIEQSRWLLWMALFTIPLPYIASEIGWVLAEVGRQPWVIQDYLPTVAAVSHIEAGAVQTTFWLFAVLFTVLLFAEIKIILKQIKTGSNEGEK